MKTPNKARDADDKQLDNTSKKIGKPQSRRKSPSSGSKRSKPKHKRIYKEEEEEEKYSED